MKILEILKKLLNKNDIKVDITYTLASLNSIVPMPKREDFIDKSKLELIDIYKRDYLKILKENKTITSIDIMSEEIYNYKNIYTELMFKLCNIDNTDVSFILTSEIDGTNEEELNNFITRIKLMLYQEEVKNLEEKTRLKLAALNEIVNELLNEKIFLRTRTKTLINTLVNEINNLHSTLITFLNQETAMRIEADTFIKNLSINTEPKSINNIDSKLILKRIKTLEYYMNTIMPNELKNLKSKNLNPKLYIAVLEEKLEMFVYNNSELLLELEQRINNVYDEIVNINILENNILNERKDEYLKKVENIEILYEIFSKYGRNLVYKKNLEKLYEVKFKIVTSGILYEKVNILDIIKFTELECYQEIVFKKLENILKGNNENINNIPNGLSLISEIFKNNNDEYSTYKILDNRKLLAFLLSCDYEEGIIKFFNEYMVNINKYEVPTNSKFKWNNLVPLATIMKLNDCKYLNKIDVLYQFYKLISDKFINKEFYIMPEGLNSIKFELHSITKDNYLLDMIDENSKDKVVYTPKTLRSINGWFDLDCNILIVNDGCENFTSVCFNGSEKKISIPASLKVLFFNFDDFCCIDSIIFRDYKNSNILNNLESQSLLINDLFYVDVKSTKMEEEKRKENIEKRFKNLYFESENEYFCIRSDELNYSIYRNLGETGKLKDDEIVYIISALKNKIKEKSQNTQKIFIK